MTPNLSITLNTPHVTIERYSELTGLPVDTINDMLADGRLPRHRLRKDKKREKVMINIVALNRSAEKATNRKLRNTNGYSSMRSCCPEALTPVKRKWICFCVAAACHLEPGCACSTGISTYTSRAA